MKQNGRSANSYFIFMLLLLMLIIGLNLVTSHQEDYTRTEFLTDLQEGNVSEVVISPNGEAPTGYLTIELKNGQNKILYATDITELEALVRDKGYDPVVTDIERKLVFECSASPTYCTGSRNFLLYDVQCPECRRWWRQNDELWQEPCQNDSGR